MIEKEEKLRVGMKLYDSKLDRTVLLSEFFNPMGDLAYFSVVNQESDRKSIIREDRLHETRWSIV